MALVSGGLNYYGDAGIAPSPAGQRRPAVGEAVDHQPGRAPGFWNRLNVDVELYHKKNSAMLMEVPVSYTTSNGFGFRWDNVGDMTNRGVEVSLAADVIQHKDFVWSVNANVSYNRNKMTKLYSGVSEYELSSTNTKLVVGHSFGEFYLNRFAGVNPANGDALWYTKEGELTTELRDEDKVMVGKSYVAPWQGGFGTTLAWKGLSLSAQFSWVADRWMINNDRYFDESNGRFASYNQSKRLLNRWKKPGDITDIPRHGVYTEFDDRLLEDASFLRLKNLMLSYSFPQEWLRKTRFISGVKIYAQAQNLFTFTKFTGLDPEGSEQYVPGTVPDGTPIHLRTRLNILIRDYEHVTQYKILSFGPRDTWSAPPRAWTSTPVRPSRRRRPCAPSPTPSRRSPASTPRSRATRFTAATSPCCPTSRPTWSMPSKATPTPTARSGAGTYARPTCSSKRFMPPSTR